MRTPEESLQYLKDIVAGSRNDTAAFKGRSAYLIDGDTALRIPVKTKYSLNLSYDFDSGNLTYLKREPEISRVDRKIRERGNTFYVEFSDLERLFENILAKDARAAEIVFENKGGRISAALVRKNKRKKEKILLREVTVNIENLMTRDFSASIRAFPFQKMSLKAFSPYAKIGVHPAQNGMVFFQNDKNEGKTAIVAKMTIV